MSVGDCRRAHYTVQALSHIIGPGLVMGARLGLTADRLAFPPANLAILAEKDLRGMQ